MVGVLVVAAWSRCMAYYASILATDQDVLHSTLRPPPTENWNPSRLFTISSISLFLFANS
jgi:hypothetical protein